MKKLGIPAGVIVVVLLLAWMLLPALIWDGATNVQFRFHVVESGSKRPVKNARIRALRDYQLAYLSDTNFAVMFPAVTTDAAGSAILPVMCGAGGSQGLFGKTGKFVISHELSVEADGYRPIAVALANVVGGRRWPLSKREFDIQLELFKSP